MEQQTPQNTLTKDPRSGEALTVRRLFTRAGVHPFDSVEWETRTAAVGSFRQEGVEFLNDVVAERGSAPRSSREEESPWNS